MDTEQNTVTFGTWSLIGLWFVFAFIVLTTAGLMSWQTGRELPYAPMIALAIGFLMMFFIILALVASRTLRRLRNQ